ncbi:MAG: enoyl-CoA hydratase/isomerase family protein [Dehalococcoidia bacterium]|nr:enoyl-CoA hydratase/isomerase family protein [Dehalococcoidia bacterium]
MADYITIIVERQAGVLILTLNRPDTLNALNQKLLHEASEVIEQASIDDNVKVLVITGAGRGFSSGADLAPPAPGEDPPPAATRRTKLTPFGRFGRLALAISNCPKPIIVAVNGACVGGAFGMALGCDIRIASDKAKFSAIFVRRGLHPDCGITYHLPRIVGPGKALELCMTGDMIDAYEAEKLGIVNRVVSHDQLMTTTMELANRLANGPSIVIELTKQAIYHSYTADFETQLGFEGWCQNICTASADVQEGRKAFLEKRDPVFRGE